MNKEEYNRLLTTGKWKRKRAKILKRDEFKCTKCGETHTLQVHHIWYIEGNMPWQVPDDYLITLCRPCHEAEHEGRPIHSFIKHLKKKSCHGGIPRTQKKKHRKKNNKGKTSKIDWKLSKRDKMLQKRYDSLKK